MKTSERGEIATILTLGVLVVIGVSAMVSSLFLNQKKTTKSRASEPCKEEFFCIDKTCMKRFTNCSQDFATNQNECVGLPCGPQQTNSSTSQSQGNGGAGAPTCPVNGKGGLDNNNACNPACCESDGQCPGSQKCNIPNGFCKSTTSCNPNKEAKFHTTCVGGACVKQACPDTGTCVDDCSSCSGGGTTTTGSSGTTAGDPTRCPGADNTWVDVGQVRGNLLCCAANDNPENEKWGWATWGKDKKCINGKPTSTTTSTNKGNPAGPDCFDYDEKSDCKSFCSDNHVGYSCGFSSEDYRCCRPKGSQAVIPSPTPACIKYKTTFDCANKCESEYPGSTCPQGSLYCCSAGGNTTKITPTSSPTTVLSPTEKLWWEKINTPAPSLSPTRQPTPEKESTDNRLKLTSIPTVVQQAFCPNPNIPSFPSGVLVVGLYNERSEGSSVDLATMMNESIDTEVRKTLRTANSLNDVRSIIVRWVYSGFFNGANATLTDIARRIDTSGLNTVTIKLGGFTVKKNILFTIKGNIKTMALQSSDANVVGMTLNSLIDAYVGSVINTICK